VHGCLPRHDRRPQRRAPLPPLLSFPPYPFCTWELWWVTAAGLCCHRRAVTLRRQGRDAATSRSSSNTRQRGAHHCSRCSHCPATGNCSVPLPHGPLPLPSSTLSPRRCAAAHPRVTSHPPQLIAPTHTLLAPSLDLHFDDIPGGIQAISYVPAAGWAQIIALVGAHELTINKQDYTKVPGENPAFLGFKPEDPAVFKEKQLKELKNGRLAMIAVLGELMAQQVSGYGTYEQLFLIINDLPSF